MAPVRGAPESPCGGGHHGNDGPLPPPRGAPAELAERERLAGRAIGMLTADQLAGLLDGYRVSTDLMGEQDSYRDALVEHATRTDRVKRA